MTLWTLNGIEHAIRASWGLDTCDPNPSAYNRWRPDNPARGQCGVTALVLHDLLGGELLLADVAVGGEQDSVHYWNRFPVGIEVDLTREQFDPHEHVGVPNVVTRPPGAPRRCAEQYELLRSRVFHHLGLQPESATTSLTGQTLNLNSTTSPSPSRMV